jgi:hypothetical protein
MDLILRGIFGSDICTSTEPRYRILNIAVWVVEISSRFTVDYMTSSASMWAEDIPCVWVSDVRDRKLMEFMERGSFGPMKICVNFQEI